MTGRLTVLTTPSTDPYHNLGLEEYLLDRVRPGECILYLWQNQRTVVIGRNQNAESECRFRLLEQEGGHLARRLSGGGAVYHDLGNLNFTFLMPTEDFDKEKQTDVILAAVQKAGIRAEKSGRNDLTVDGRKFSGHAFYHSGSKSYHHGTLMVEVDQEPMARYLNVSPLKLQAKGVQSVRSRTGNLRDWKPGLTIEELKQHLMDAFQEIYGFSAELRTEADLDSAALEQYRRKFASPEWLYGTAEPLDFSREARFGWGTVRVDWSVKDGAISRAALWSDGLEADYLQEAPARIRGVPAERSALEQALAAGGGEEYSRMAADLAALITQ